MDWNGFRTPLGHLKGKISDYGHISERKKKNRERRKKHNNEKDIYVF